METHVTVKISIDGDVVLDEFNRLYRNEFEAEDGNVIDASDEISELNSNALDDLDVETINSDSRLRDIILDVVGNERYDAITVKIGDCDSDTSFIWMNLEVVDDGLLTHDELINLCEAISESICDNELHDAFMGAKATIYYTSCDRYSQHYSEHDGTLSYDAIKFSIASIDIK